MINREKLLSTEVTVVNLDLEERVRTTGDQGHGFQKAADTMLPIRLPKRGNATRSRELVLCRRLPKWLLAGLSTSYPRALAI